MHFTILNNILLSPNWTSFLYKAVITIGIPSDKILKFLNHFSLFFQKTKMKDCFKFSILTYAWIDLQLQILNKFLFLNGISIVVVINSWLKQYVMNLTKLAHS